MEKSFKVVIKYNKNAFQGCVYWQRINYGGCYRPVSSVLLQQAADQTGAVPAQAAEEQEGYNCEAIARRRGGADQKWLQRQSLQ